MSYFALVAYQNENGTFDVHTSHNGGEEFYLKPILDKVASGELDRSPTDVDPRLPWDDLGGLPDDVDPVSSSEELISESPKYQNVPYEGLPKLTGFINVEAFYLVQGDTVECYLPVWTYPNVLEALREMYILDIYELDEYDLLDNQGDFVPPEQSDAEPIRSLRGDDFAPGAVQEPALRRYLERNHLNLFQTSTERQSDDALAPSEGIFQMDELTRIKPRETDWRLDNDYGRGVFVQIPWDEDEGPLFLHHTRRYVESLRIETSKTILQSESETAREELKMIGKLVKHFGNRVSKNAVSPYDEHIESFYSSFGAGFTSEGDLFRVIDSPAKGVGQFRLRKLDKVVTPMKDLRTLESEGMIQTVEVKKESEYQPLLETLGSGDIIRAELDTSVDNLSGFISVELIKRFRVDFVTDNFVPAQIRDIYENKLKPELSRSDSKTYHVRSNLPVTDLEGIEINIGEQIVAEEGADPDTWKETKLGNLSEEVYGGFLKNDDESPAEAILVNPPSEPFWYGLIYSEPQSPYAPEMRQQLNISSNN